MSKKLISDYLYSLYDSCIHHFPEKKEEFLAEYKLNAEKLDEMDISDFYSMLHDELCVLHELNTDNSFDVTLYCHAGILSFIKDNIFN